MDGMLTKVVGHVRRDDGPRPFSTSDAMAAQVVGERHARAMAEQARAMAAQCRPSPAFHAPVAYNPAAAAAAAERHLHRVEARRVFLADRVDGLRDAGRITAAQHRAAREIHELLSWAEAGRCMLARSQFRERMAVSTGEGLAVQERIEEAERTRYRPWKLWAAQYVIGHDRTLEGLTLAVVVQGHGLRQVANAWRMDQRRAEALLVRSLACYATLAGWEGARDQA